MLVKFRAEAQIDIDRLFELIPDNFIVGKFVELDPLAVKFGTGDLNVTLAMTNFSLKKLRDLIATIPDGHIMYDTLALIENYTGERFKDGEFIENVWSDFEDDKSIVGL